MIVKEFYSGSGILAETFKKAGHTVRTYDINPKYNPDIIWDVLTYEGEYSYAHVMWFSVPCYTFSVASIGTHWKGGRGAYIPKTKKCKQGLAMLEKSIMIIAQSKPDYWFIENPRGVMRKVIDRLFAKHGLRDIYGDSIIRTTVTYCQYGDNSMKPTDIWHNCPHWKPRPMCKNGDPCHVRAPRGAKTGTQGKKGAFERGKLPKQLCIEIVEACER